MSKIIAELKVGHQKKYVLIDRYTFNGWISLKVEKKLPGPRGRTKRNWWIAWNGERLSRTRDAGLLHKHEPEIYEWVVETLTPLDAEALKLRGDDREDQ